MLEKSDRKHYFRLGVVWSVLGLTHILAGFIAGVSASWKGSLIHLTVPYYGFIPTFAMAACLFAAYHTGKRWPLGVWIPVFIVHLAFLFWQLMMIPYTGMEIYFRYPCYVQTHRTTGESRCICANDGYDYMTINGKTTTDSCVRALTLVTAMSQLSYCAIVISLVPLFISFVLVCNDLCCVSCRRASSMPQVLVTEGGVATTVVLQQAPGPSTGVVVVPQAGPLPVKQQDAEVGPLPAKQPVPHSY